jgi:NADPH:quinone reductase-like Zn-dependent oxidoreductase
VKFENVLGAGTVNGTLAQYIVLDDGWLVEAPKNLTFEEAATLGCAAGTAINVLSSVPIGKGTTVVTQGTGGVSCFAIQVEVPHFILPMFTEHHRAKIHIKFAAAKGATVIATSSEDFKLQKAEQLGASSLVNYKTSPDWAEEVLKITNGRGADLVLDIKGAETLSQSVKASRTGGTLCVIGANPVAVDASLIPMLVLGAKTCMRPDNNVERWC